MRIVIIIVAACLISFKSQAQDLRYIDDIFFILVSKNLSDAQSSLKHFQYELTDSTADNESGKRVFICYTFTRKSDSPDKIDVVRLWTRYYTKKEHFFEKIDYKSTDKKKILGITVDGVKEVVNKTEDDCKLRGYQDDDLLVYLYSECKMDNSMIYRFSITRNEYLKPN